MRKVKQDVLAEQIRQELENMIMNGELRPGDKLESEPVLAEQFGVSRVTLRDALRMMEGDGLIVKKNGVGTFISEPDAFISGRLEVDFSLTDAAKAAGIPLETVNLECEYRLPTAEEFERLQLHDGDRVVCYRRKRYVGKDCIVFSIDVLPAESIPTSVAGQLQNRSLYLFIENELHRPIEAGVAELTATEADEYLAEQMGIRLEQPLMLVEQVDETPNYGPILYSKEYYNSKRFKFKIRRQRNMEQYAMEYLNKERRRQTEE